MRGFERSPRDEWCRVERHRKGAKKWRNKRSNLQTKGQISLNGGMRKGSRDDDGEKAKRRILKRYQVSETQENEQKFDALSNQNTYQPASSGGPVREGQTTGKSSNTQGSPSKPNKRRHCNNLKDFERRIKSSFVRAGCSKHCTGIKDAHAASQKPTVCTSAKKNRWESRLKRSKRKLRQISKQLKKTTDKSVRRIKTIYRSIVARRAQGFTCDLKRCESTLQDCSTSSCAKPHMLFSKSHQQNEKITRDKDQRHYTVCRSKVPRSETLANELDTHRESKRVKDKSIETKIDKATNT